MRLFTAFIPPNHVLDHVATIQTHLKPEMPSVKWTPRNNLHITLLFIGKVKKKQVPELITSLKDIVSPDNPIKLTLGTPYIFPSRKNPRVVSIKVTDLTSPHTKDIQRNIFTQVKSLRIPVDHPKPLHITIGRYKKGIRVSKEEIRFLQNISIPKVSWEQKGYSLIQSTLTRTGATYATLKEIHIQ